MTLESPTVSAPSQSGNLAASVRLTEGHYLTGFASGLVSRLTGVRSLFLNGRRSSWEYAFRSRQDVMGGKVRSAHILGSIVLADLLDGAPIEAVTLTFEWVNEYLRAAHSVMQTDNPLALVPLMPAIQAEGQAQHESDAQEREVLANANDAVKLNAALKENAEHIEALRVTRRALLSRLAAIETQQPTTGGTQK